MKHNLPNLKRWLIALVVVCSTLQLNASDLIINEVLADPATGTPGDANGDGIRDFSQDEFVELVNNGADPIDISGYKIFDGFGLRHVFPTNTVIPAGGSLVIFGGGSPSGTFGGSLVQTASNGALGLNNGGDQVVVTDAIDTEITRFDYDGSFGGDNQSMTKSPDLTGAYAKHSEVAAGTLFSPGTKVDGTPFIGNPQPITSYSENFDDCPLALTSWTPFSVKGDQVWSCTNFGRNGTSGVQMNGFSGGAIENEDWLISPELDLRFFNFPILSFWARSRFNGPSLELRASTNYDGSSDPNLANWTTVQAFFPAVNSNEWTEVGNIDLSGYKQKGVYLAWFYISSPTLAASRWTFDDFQIENNDSPPAGASPVTIAEARALPSGSIVTLTGILTVADQLGGPAYLQDATGGIAINDDQVNGDSLYAVGDSIRVTGIRAVANDQLTVASLVAVEDLGVAQQTVQPVIITLSQLDDYRGQLVQVLDAAFPQPDQELLWGNSNFTLTDGSGEGVVRIDRDVTDLVGKAQPVQCDVTGVVGHFRGTSQLLPRKLDDVPCAEDFVAPSNGTASDQTFDVVAWNVEWFGNASNGPSPEDVQKENVKQAILDIDADVYAFQEVSNEFLFQEMADELDEYEAVISLAVSSPPNNPGSSQKVAYLYKTSVVSLVEEKPLLTTVSPRYNGGDESFLPGYPGSGPRLFWSSGRMPYLMVADVNINGVKERYHLVNIHAKANTSNGSYERRQYDMAVLKDSLDGVYDTDNVILLGDYNDDLDFTVAGNDAPTSETSYAVLVNDTIPVEGDQNYYFPITRQLSELGYRTFTTSSNVIDHIVVSDELEDNYVDGSAIVRYDVYTPQFTQNTTDHLPVFISLKVLPEETKVTDFSLVDAQGDTLVGDLVNGQDIDLAQYPKFTIVADVSNTDEVSSVIFEVDGTVEQRESRVPYTLAGEHNGDFKSFEPQNSNVLLKATPYSGKNGKGNAGVPLEYRFNIVNSATVEGFQLIDAENDMIVGPLMQNDTIDVSVYSSFSINAITNTANVGSVGFEVNGTAVRTDNSTDYTLGGDKGAKYRPYETTMSNNTLVTTPYSGKNGSGFEGVTSTLDFNVMNLAEITSLILVDAKNDVELGEITEGMVIDLDTLPKYSIMAKTNRDQVASVLFKVNGEDFKMEGFPPYVLSGDTKGDFKAFDSPLGTVTVEVIPFSERRTQGFAGKTTSVTFEVIDSTPDQEINESNFVSQGMLLYPNPAADQLHVANPFINKEGELQIQVADGLGFVLMEETRSLLDKQYALNITSLPEGVYFLTVTSHEGRKVMRLVVK